MIVRVINNNVRVLSLGLNNNEEKEFMVKNTTGGFKQIDKLPSSKKYPLCNNYKWNGKKVVVDDEANKIDDVNNKNQAIETFIYSNYSQKKQAQDNGWVSNFTTKLVASGVTDLDKQVVDFASSFLKGTSLNEVLADVDDAVKPMFEKLVKVAVKNEWCYKVIQEGKLAIKENREPVYSEFPKFD